ncbi:MAG TPA: bifunctional methylenetetrahydrofolate dehydrogenase/methenyltetrahydrofolate cyclohydrolase [Cyanobacteria bacterium UBA10660]|nr:MAG TPA: bifunctional methylenetetrahydrofolate dehydrogenase/methenyltetrahydrofolate cyclohydrolase [Candidatus Gastranaerophilales bacterium HUM_1]HAS94306.1 bifunctional methylenetetrahydrofolate dehydrogenase/methenyltetrahydrofolate cyclohydrolase [Cyanobacteria bacterium UBA10660]
MTTILDGKKLRDKIIENLKTKVDTFDEKPTLVVILVGENPASKIYVNNKKKMAEKIGIHSEVINYPANITEAELLDKIEELNNNKKVTAILVQLPLPKHISKDNVMNKIIPSKDVDGFTPYNFGKLFSGETPTVYPCTPKGILLLLDEYNIEIEGKHVVIVGRSNIVGKPLSQMMLNKNATVTICHSHTKNLSQITKTADILVSAVGKNIIEGEMLKTDCVIVDVGIFKDENGKTRGDVDFESASKIASFISPVPGGVGPMTIASLMLNTVELFEKNSL